MMHLDSQIPVTFEDIQAASRRINPYILHTPLIPSRFLSEKCAVPVLLKLECLQPTGSFKIRGATNRLLQLNPEEKQRGVITVSSGNHGRALAYTAARLGIPATIFLSVHTPINKVEAIRKTGAVTMVTGDCYDDDDSARHSPACGSRR